MMKTCIRGLLMLSLALGLGATVPPDLSKQQWNGNAVCYSGYRTGQHPDKKLFPGQSQVLEDLRILEKQWRLIRLYGSDQHSRNVLEVIQRNKLNLRVMLGLWLSGKPEKQGENERQITTGISLAKAFPGIVIAINVGNEALVSWSDHRMTEAEMIKHVRRVKAAVKCPITVADDFLYWAVPGNRLVEHLDFITLHSYPLWGYLDIDKGLSATIDKFEQVRRIYPDKTIVFGEVGWASYTVGDKHVPRAGDEVKQKRYYDEINAWARSHDVTTFLFEAFDEPWKGEGTEGHWGLFSVDRKAKLAMRELYPELMPGGATSPSYDTSTRPAPKPNEK